MSRIIKFRAWDKRLIKGVDTRDMLYNAQFHELWRDFFDYPDVYELMQFTGLTDFYGEEIYEGDIVKSGILSGEVKMLNGSWTFDNFPLNDYDVTILGNRFENPNLLK